MPGLLVLCGHVRADCFCPATQCLDHRKFVGQWVVGHKVHVGGFPVYSRRDGAIWVPLEEDIQKQQLAVRLQLNCELYAGFHRKMNSLLTDSKTYKRLTTDPTLSLERKMNEMLLHHEHICLRIRCEVRWGLQQRSLFCSFVLRLFG